MKKFIRNRVFLILAAGALALGIAGGALLAINADTAHAHGNRGGGSGNFAAQVAAKLNGILGLSGDEAVTESQMQAAFNGVAADQQEEKLQARLAQLEVAEDAASAIMAWFRAYPYADLVKLRPLGLASSEKVAATLDRLVEKERITQTQADGIRSWYADRPDLPEGLERSGREGRGKKGHHRRGDRDNGGESSDNDDGAAESRYNGNFHRRGRGHGGGNGNGEGAGAGLRFERGFGNPLRGNSM